MIIPYLKLFRERIFKIMAAVRLIGFACLICSCNSNPQGTGIDLIASKGMTGWRESGNWENVGDVSADGEDLQIIQKNGAGMLTNLKPVDPVDLLSVSEFGDIKAHIEFMVPENSNSGVYFMGRYEIQILDSYGKTEAKFHDCGGIYERWNDALITEMIETHGDSLGRILGNQQAGYEGRAPKVNAARPAGQWQTYDVIFHAPRFNKKGAKIKNARFVSVVHNGITIHENVEVTGPTRAARFLDEKPLGPLMLQGDHGPVAYRNIKIWPLLPADQDQ